jgi:translocation and assembly module TamB
LPAWLITTHFAGNVERLPLTAQIEQPFHAAIVGEGFTLNANWKFKGDATVKDFDLRPFGGGNALGIISGKLKLGADSTGFTAQGALTPPGLNAGAMNVDFAGHYSNRRLTIQRASAHHAASDARGTVRGQIDVTNRGPQLTLNGEWTRFRWPLAADAPAFTSPTGHYTLNGTKPWGVTAQGEVIKGDLPVMRGRVEGVLAGDALRVDKGTLQLFEGNAAFSGEARWSPAQSWQAKGRMTDLNPAALREDLPGRLHFDFNASGAPFGAGGNIEFDAVRLSGQLRQQQASGKGHFSLPAGGTTWQFNQVDLSFGRTRVQLDGGLGEQRDLRFVVDAEDLSLFDADAMGRISASGRIAGSDAAPVLAIKARGSGFEWRGGQLASMDADIDVDLRGNGRTTGDVELKNLQMAGRTAERVAIHLEGSATAQRFAIEVDATPLRAALAGRGTISSGLWQGEVQRMSLEDGRQMQLQLEAPAPLQFAVGSVELQNLCLKGKEERFCGAGTRRTEGDWRTTFSAETLPLRAMTAGLTQDIDYEGTINLRAELMGSQTVPMTGNVHAQLQEALLRHRLSNGRDERMSLGSGSVDATASSDSFSVQVGLDAGTSGNIRASLSGTRGDMDWHDYPITGSLDVSTDALGLLDIYLGGIDKATGRLNTRVAVGGTLGRPTVRGILQLRDAAIDIYQVNLALRALSLDATFDTEALDLSGQSRVGDGEVKFDGKLAWRQGEPFGNLHVSGENLRVVNVPEARIDASPDLNFKLAGRRVEATGEVRIPYAKLKPADLTDAVLSSGDEVIIGAPVVDPAQRWTVFSDIRMTLGDQVSIDSLGLNGKLGGSIAVHTDDTQISRGQGELNIVSGKYMAMGRLLDIQRGRLIYNNVPLGDPGVDLRAQKVYPDITAGVNVRGSLRAPRLTFFSEPAIPQSQIASLILAGGSLESVQNSSRPGAARNDLLAQGGAILAQQFGSRVGVDDVGIESDLSNETSLVLGKYLSPRLYLSYGISLAEAINTLKLRYTIGDRWTIKTEAGRTRSADIVYTIQK